MNLPSHIIEIRNKLVNDQIDWRDAIEALQKSTEKKKPWHYKEWKEKRDLLIEDTCSQCGSSDEHMVLQHLWHPRKFNVILHQLSARDLEANRFLKEQYLNDLFENSKDLSDFPIGMRKCCPKCESTNIRFKKTKGEWDCSSKKSVYGRVVWRCGHSFKEPMMLEELTPDQKRQLSEIKMALRQKAHDKFDDNQIKDAYGKQAVLESIKDTERYLSMQDTTTFCRKCAYLMDIKNLILCKQCNTYILKWLKCSCTAESTSL